MSYLINSYPEKFEGISLNKEIDYIVDPTKIKIKKKKFSLRFINQFSSFIFILNSFNKNSIQLCSTIEILFLCHLTRLIRRSSNKILFRPGIDWFFIKRDLKNRFGIFSVIFEIIFKVFIPKTIFIFQTEYIKHSYKTIRKDISGDVIINPIDLKNTLPKFSYDRSKPSNCIFIGRMNNVKGIDRFIELSKKKLNNNLINFHAYGEPKEIYEHELSIHFHGWQSKKDFKSENQILILPSRTEGLPNIMYEALQAKWKVIISKEVYELIKFDEKIMEYVEVIDFDKINSFQFDRILPNSDFNYEIDFSDRTIEIFFEKVNKLATDYN
tara:strand:+ start:3613 stop:4590 length:978 start_codon:yes stop_codon:yes gene_type:complete